jgi:hypothetical protein
MASPLIDGLFAIRGRQAAKQSALTARTSGVFLRRLAPSVLQEIRKRQKIEGRFGDGAFFRAYWQA